MKPIALFIVTIFLLPSCKKDKDKAPTAPGFRYFNGESCAFDNSAFITADKNLILCANDGDNISILKISRSGDQIWRKDFNPGEDSYAGSIVETGNGDLYICGQTGVNYLSSKSDFLLVKTNSSGDTIWTKTYGGAEPDFGRNIIATSDGNLLIAGETQSFGGSSDGEIYLIKVNLDGDTLWTRTFIEQDENNVHHLLETKNGEYLITGSNQDQSDLDKLYLLKISSAGAKLWERKIGPSGYKSGSSTIELPNGNLLTTGERPSFMYAQVMLVMTDNQGNMIWEKEYGISNIAEDACAIKPNADGTFTILGSAFNINTFESQILLLKVDENGSQLYMKKFSASTWDIGVNLLKDDNNDNIITGDSEHGIFITRTDNDGNFK